MSFKQVIFYILIAVFYVFMFLSTSLLIIDRKFMTKKAVFIVSMSTLIFVLSMYGFLSAFSVSTEKFSITPGKLCRGGPYTWQGNSPRAQMCRQMYSTPEGKAEIDRYQCGTGYNGMPGKGFVFTPLSNNRWCNERCKKGKPEDENDVSRNGIF